jgi:hypothetical protein
MMENLVEWRLAGETEVLGENPPQLHFVHHKFHLPDPGWNPGRSVGKPVVTWAMARPYIYIVTCQPIVGLRNRAFLGSRPLNASRPNTRYATTGEAVFTPCRAVPCWAEPHRALLRNRPRWRHTVPRSFPRQLCCKHGDLTQHSSHLARCCSDACTIEGYIRGTEMSKKAVFKKQLYESVVK